MFKLLLFIVTMSSIENCDSAKILGIFPVPVLSHQMVFSALSQELAKRGHQMTVLTSYSVTNGGHNENYTEIDLSYIGERFRKDLLSTKLTKPKTMLEQFELTLSTAYSFMNAMIQTEEVQNLIKNNKNSFDLLLIEDCVRSALIFSHFFKAPVILVSSFGGSFDTFDIVGGNVHPLLYPLATRKRFQNLSSWDKISEIYAVYQLQKLNNKVIMLQDEYNKNEYGMDTPTIDELKKNVRMAFLNVHSIWDSNRPVPPNVVYTGGLHRQPEKDLPKDLKLSLDSSTKGAIYVSFGATVDFSVFSNTLQTFINVFSKLPYDIYWKWNSEKLPELPKNIKTSNWFPQADLLRHPNVKLFITQGGLQSTDEAIAAGVPLIGLPVFWDQWFNVDKYLQLKIGLKLDLETITEDELRNAIETVIGNKEYKTNIIKLRSIMHDSPESSLERAVWWTEYVLRHGAEHLRTPDIDMSWKEYYEVKIILYVLTIIILIAITSLITLKRVLKRLINIYYSNKTKID